MHEPPYRIKNMMPGMIMLWYGSVASIPSGWHLCDGAMGTPDLRNKFVPCAGGAYPVGFTGGATNHQHDFTGDGHSHILLEGNDIQAGDGFYYATDDSEAVGTTDWTDGRPEFHALCYIMKL